MNQLRLNKKQKKQKTVYTYFVKLLSTLFFQH